MSIRDVYSKVYIDSLFTSYFTKEQMTVSLNTKLNLNALDTYYTKLISIICLKIYSQTQIDNFSFSEANKTDVFNKIEINALLNNKLETTIYNTAINLKSYIGDVYLKNAFVH